ncbi:MAG: ferredoxin [Pseudomonadota bacterium]
MVTVRLSVKDIELRAARAQLSVMGTVTEDLPQGIRTLFLLGPQEPGFWPVFSTSAEYGDGADDPLDRWSSRVIGTLADDLGGRAFFPFGGPPHQPFFKWAQLSGRAHGSPVGLLVHDTAGLMVSYRGAIGFSYAISTPKPNPNPCITCEMQACLTACPVGALKGADYDVPACKADLDRPGNDCMARGCAVRRACPVSQSYARDEAQSAFHMEAFL